MSCAISLDGYLNDTSSSRLMISNDQDFDAVDALRASCDAILVGAGTLRIDNPRLVIKSENRRNERRSRGQAPDPAKVTITGSGVLNPGLNFFTLGESQKIVYATEKNAAGLRKILEGKAEVISDGREELDLVTVLEDLSNRGIKRLLVEGGTKLNTHFLTANLVHELRLSIAPFFVGEANAPRFVGDGRFPYNSKNRMNLKKIERINEIAVLHYEL